MSTDQPEIEHTNSQKQTTTGGKANNNNNNNNDATSFFMYVMGYIYQSTYQDDDTNANPSQIQCIIQPSLSVSMHVVYVHDPCTGVLEMLLICKGKSLSEKQWEKHIHKSVQGPLFRVQATVLVTQGESGAACMSRMIEKAVQQRLRLSTEMSQPHYDSLLDAYRMASGGKMHVLDTERAWLMTSRALSSMNRDKLQCRFKRIVLLDDVQKVPPLLLNYTELSLPVTL